MSKLNISDELVRQRRIEILIEALWTLNNIVNEDKYDIDERLFLDHNIQQILQAHLLENFIEEANSQTSSSNSFPGSHYMP